MIDPLDGSLSMEVRRILVGSILPIQRLMGTLIVYDRHQILDAPSRCDRRIRSFDTVANGYSLSILPTLVAV